MTITQPWEVLLQQGVQAFLDQVVVPSGCIDSSHIVDTPARVVKSFTELTSGLFEDPSQYLEKRFDGGTYNEMITEHSIDIVSLCAHHWAPILGKATFAYIPGDYIVGLSKIPRMIGALAHRPQVQENLTEQIVDIFCSVVHPKGCAVNIRASHCCMKTRGVREHGVITETTALRGVFSYPLTRAEFLQSINRTERIFP